MLGRRATVAVHRWLSRWQPLWSEYPKELTARGNDLVEDAERCPENNVVARKTQSFVTLHNTDQEHLELHKRVPHCAKR